MGKHEFSNIIGQQPAVEHLQNAIQTGQISHAYIVCGEKGTGKYELAACFGAALLCESPVKTEVADGRGGTHVHMEPCGLCHACMQTETGNHPDLITVTHKKRNASDTSKTLGVDDIRAMRSDVQIKPYSGSHKIYILPDADEMTAQAQNALLKTLEEPPAYAVIFLLAKGTTGFLPTVLSRCITLRLGPVPEPELESYLLNKIGVSEVQAGVCARLSHGNPGRARFLATSERYEDFREQVLRFVKHLKDANSFEIAQFAEEAAGKTSKKKADDAPEADFDTKAELEDLLQSFLRDILAYKSSGKTDNLIFRDEVQYIKETAQTMSFSQMEAMRRALDEAARREARGGNEVQILQMQLLKIRDAMKA